MRAEMTCECGRKLELSAECIPGLAAPGPAITLEWANQRIAELCGDVGKVAAERDQLRSDLAALRAERAKPHPLLVRVAEAGPHATMASVVVFFTIAERDALRKELGL